MWLMLAVMMIGQEPQPYVVVLGVAQDAGVPQAGTQGDPAWDDPHMRRFAACLGLVDPASGQRWMFEATPDFKYQLHHLNTVEPADDRPGLNGIFITHAHIGHYTGLMHLGHEVMGAQNVPVFVMPRMAKFLASNGPWDQLVRYKNLQLHHLEEGAVQRIARGGQLLRHFLAGRTRLDHPQHAADLTFHATKTHHHAALVFHPRRVGGRRRAGFLRDHLLGGGFLSAAWRCAAHGNALVRQNPILPQHTPGGGNRSPGPVTST